MGSNGRVEEQDIFGDEDFIFNMAQGQRAPERENNILDGYVVLDEDMITFKKVRILEGNMTIIMPEAHEVMTEEMSKGRYGAEDRPDVTYTFYGNDINFALSYKNGLPSEDEDIPGVKDLVERMVMRSFPGSKVIDSATVQGSGRTVGYFDFASEVYNLIFFFSFGENLVMGSFECYKTCMNDWKPLFLQMIGSMEDVP